MTGKDVTVRDRGVGHRSAQTSVQGLDVGTRRVAGSVASTELMTKAISKKTEQ